MYEPWTVPRPFRGGYPHHPPKPAAQSSSRCSSRFYLISATFGMSFSHSRTEWEALEWSQHEEGCTKQHPVNGKYIQISSKSHQKKGLLVSSKVEIRGLGRQVHWLQTLKAGWGGWRMLPMFSLQRCQDSRDYIDLGCLEPLKVPVDSMPPAHFHLLLPCRHPYFKQKGASYH